MNDIPMEFFFFSSKRQEIAALQYVFPVKNFMIFGTWMISAGNAYSDVFQLAHSMECLLVKSFTGKCYRSKL